MDEQREEQIFHEALQLTPEQRAAYLALACAGDPLLRKRIERLLQAEIEAAPFFSEEPLGMALGHTPPPPATIVVVTEKPGDRIGRYKLLQQIGQGGCGVVYMAQQEEPVRRRVALKVIKLGLDTKSVIARFEAERQAVAMMDHPNIAKVLDAGATETGRPYFVMELVRGVKITEYCDQNKFSTRARLDVFIQVCHAIQHAHQKGIIHRDIKPSNILVCLHDGVPVPMVIDFGIAKATEQRLTDKTLFTAFEQFIGTPAYTSPEQAEMSQLDIDTRSDIYSLGVLLYELLTGTPPFDSKELLAAGLDEMRRTIREKEPLRPSTRLRTMLNGDLSTTAQHRHTEAPKLIHMLRGDLDWIVMKCLEKDRTRRYETANGLAQDIERHLQHETVVARPPSRIYRAQKFIRRNKVMVGTAGLVAAALVLGILVSTWQAVRAVRAEREQSHQRERAEANEQKALQAQANEARQRQTAEAAQASETRQRQQAEAETYAADINLAQQALTASDLGRARLLLEAYTAPGKQHLRGWEWRYLWQQCQSDALGELCRYSKAVSSVVFAPDGKVLAVTGGAPGFVDLWDVPGRRRIATVQQQAGYTVAFSLRGDLLAANANPWGDPLGAEATRGVIRVWRTDNTNLVCQITNANSASTLKFSPDGTRLASLGPFGEASVWDVDRWSIVRRIAIPSSADYLVGSLDFSSDGKALAVADAAGRLRVVDLDTGQDRFNIKAAPEGLTSVAWSPRDSTIACSGGFASGQIQLRTADSGKLLGTLDGHKGWICKVVFSADGQRLYSASGDQTIRIWDVGQRRCLAVLKGSTHELWGLALSPDGTTLVSGNRDGVVAFWSAAPRPKEEQPRVLGLGREPMWPILRPSFSPDSRVIAASCTGTVCLYDLATLKETERIPALGTNVGVVAYSLDGTLLASGSTNGWLRVWSCTERQLLQELPAHHTQFYFLGFPADGRHLLSVEAGWPVGAAKAIWWDVQNWRPLQSFEVGDVGYLSGAALSPDGRSFLSTHGSGVIRQWDLATGALVASHSAHREQGVAGIAFSPDGATVASVAEEATVALFDASSMKRTGTFTAHTVGAVGVAFARDGRRFATGGTSSREAVKLWDLATHRELITLPGQGSLFFSVAFSPDGNRLVACNWQGQVHVWHAPPMTDIDSAPARAK